MYFLKILCFETWFCKNWILFIMMVTFQPLFYMQGLSFNTALSFAASSHRKPATTRRSFDSYSAQDRNKRNTIMRLFYRVCALSYRSLSCLAPCCTHIIWNSMWCYKRKVVVEGKKIHQFKFKDGSIANRNYSQVYKYMQAALIVQKTEPNHSAECSVKRKWLKIGHTSKIPQTYTHTQHTLHRRLGFQKLHHELLQTPEI